MMQFLMFIILFWPILAIIPLIVYFWGSGIPRVKVMFALYDCWTGVYWDKKKDIWYWFPVPTIGFKVWHELSQLDKQSRFQCSGVFQSVLKHADSVKNHNIAKLHDDQEAYFSRTSDKVN